MCPLSSPTPCPPCSITVPEIPHGKKGPELASVAENMGILHNEEPHSCCLGEEVETVPLYPQNLLSLTLSWKGHSILPVSVPEEGANFGHVQEEG